MLVQFLLDERVQEQDSNGFALDACISYAIYML
jgi:hypothetical protein